MAVDMNGMLDTVFNAIHTVTLPLREFIGNSVPDFAYLILLGLSIAGGYYLNKKFPNTIAKFGVVWLILVFYLLLRFV